MGLRWIESQKIAVRPGLPEPEQVFLAWLMAQSAKGELLAAATAEAKRLSCYAGLHDGPKRLASMFAELIEQLEKPARRNSRGRRRHHPARAAL
jgi:hypothetical protein